MESSYNQRYESSVHPGFLSMDALHRSLRQDALAGQLLREVRIPAESLTRFVYAFSGKLPGLRSLQICTPELDPASQPDPTHLFPVRTEFLRSARRFHRVEALRFEDVVFESFNDFARFVCAFQNLAHLTLENVSWVKDKTRGLDSEPFARSLRLRTIEIYTRKITAYCALFDAPNLREDPPELRISPPGSHKDYTIEMYFKPVTPSSFYPLCTMPRRPEGSTNRSPVSRTQLAIIEFSADCYDTPDWYHCGGSLTFLVSILAAQRRAAIMAVEVRVMDTPKHIADAFVDMITLPGSPYEELMFHGLLRVSIWRDSELQYCIQ